MPNDETSFIEHNHSRDDLAPRRLQTLVHDPGQVLMHEVQERELGMTRGRNEVEAESVADVVGGLLRGDAGSCSIPCVATALATQN